MYLLRLRLLVDAVNQAEMEEVLFVASKLGGAVCAGNEKTRHGGDGEFYNVLNLAAADKEGLGGLRLGCFCMAVLCFGMFGDEVVLCF